MTDIAITFEPEAYSTDTTLLMGRQSAGAGFLRAFAETQPARAWCLARERAGSDAFAAMLRDGGSPDTATTWVGIHNAAELASAGLVYRPDPAISADAWRRLQHSDPAAYSLCGITHTTAHHDVMSAVAGWLTAPIEPWDAVICTSHAVLGSVMTILEAQADYLQERLGIQRLVLPQLPVIPLGVHTADFAVAPAERDAARDALGVGPDDVVVLFVGRLSALSKAHPAPMFLALEACAKGASVTLVEAGWFETDAAREAFDADARALCPTVRRITVDGRQAAARRNAWAAADIFTSLSDSIQETFGLTPIEAMASGLPVVVSDWNGYKDTVRDGIDGFRVATTTLPPTTGQPLADRYDFGVDDYHAYCGIAGQFVAVDVAALTAAYRRLIERPDLRRTMGAAGQAHARQNFDWSVVFARYQALWGELGERRRSSTNGSQARRRTRPDRPDPFTLFAAYPTAALGPKTTIRRQPGITPDLADQRRHLATVAFAQAFLPDRAMIAAILDGVSETGATTFDALRQQLDRHPTALAPAILWLAKMGVLTLG